MAKFKVWTRAGRDRGSRELEASSIYKAVAAFAGADVLCLSSPEYMRCGTDKSNPAYFITSDGSAHEFVAYELYEWDGQP